MKNKVKILFAVMLAFTLLSASVLPALAQDNDYGIHLARNFGYGGGANIRGTFTISLSGDETQVEKVSFLIDGSSIAVIDTPPFKFQFQTDDYGFGTHLLTAEYTLIDGTTALTSSLQYNFVSPEDEGKQVTTIFVGIGGVVVIALLAVALVQGAMLKGKRKSYEPGEPRNYGMLGGTVCPKCGRPFPRHLWGIKLVVGRLDRCDNCGKWSMTHRASASELAAAEAAERGEVLADQQVSAVGEKPDQKNALDDSRYVDDL
ncbi:MAG: Ig-like domain-containing protein [Anaerolineaceae bacterium]|nr:Ig-like domain-containing protein [Anaerolineaceae bacterium]